MSSQVLQGIPLETCYFQTMNFPGRPEMKSIHPTLRLPKTFVSKPPMEPLTTETSMENLFYSAFPDPLE